MVDKQSVLGMLKSLNPRTAEDFLIKPEISSIKIGRDASSSIILKNTKCSKHHCEISVDSSQSPSAISITDTSSNGVFINGVAVGKNATKQLNFNDEVMILKKEVVGNDQFIGFELVELSLKRSESNENKSSTDDKLFSQIQCLICFEVIYQPVSLLPCLHNFCGGCFSEWSKKAYDCPNCRGKVRAVKRNHLLVNIIDIFLEKHGDKKRDPEEIKELESVNKFSNDITELSDDEAEEEKAPQNICRQCPKMVQGFKCSRNEIHIPCSKCNRQMPLRPTTPQTCAVCLAYFCNLYWKTNPRCMRGLNPLVHYIQHTFSRIPSTAINSNKFEQKVLQDYMKRKKLNARTFADAVITKLEKEKWLLNVAAKTGVEMKRAYNVCEDCALPLWEALLYRFRDTIKKDLNPVLTKRPDCWYGRECRTQQHNSNHAEKYNHICEPSRR